MICLRYTNTCNRKSIVTQGLNRFYSFIISIKVINMHTYNHACLYPAAFPLCYDKSFAELSAKFSLCRYLTKKKRSGSISCTCIPLPEEIRVQSDMFHWRFSRSLRFTTTISMPICGSVWDQTVPGKQFWNILPCQMILEERRDGWHENNANLLSSDLLYESIY